MLRWLDVFINDEVMSTMYVCEVWLKKESRQRFTMNLTRITQSEITGHETLNEIHFKIIGERGWGKRRETCTGLGRAGEGREHAAAVFRF